MELQTTDCENKYHDGLEYQKVRLNKDNEAKPPDTFYLVEFLFLLVGIMYLLPISFFVTANDYWMNKFRNTSLNSTDPNDRSRLQSNFASGSTIAQTVPTIICMILATIYGHKIKARIRVLFSLVVLSVSFIVATIFVKVNTDSWQTWFFGITMTILVVMNGVLALFQVSILTIIAKFPRRFMKVFLVGQGVGGILTSALQVVSLAIGPSSEAAALIYFSIGTILCTFILVLFYLAKEIPLYRYCVNSKVEDTKRDSLSFKEISDVSKKIWSSLAIGMFCAFAFVPTHPAIASLVVSENYGQGNLWNDKYFVAVITFLFSDISALVGRIVAAVFTKTLNPPLLSAVAFLRMIVFVPLFMFCNALPRKHLSVLFPHDWQYVIILGSFFISSGYFLNIAFLNINKLAPGKEEIAYILLETSIGIVGAAFSPLSVLIVNLL